MGFAEERGALVAELTQLESLLRQVQNAGRALEERAGALAGQTETLADDTALAHIGTTARRVRQETAALLRSVAAARDQVDP